MLIYISNNNCNISNNDCNISNNNYNINNNNCNISNTNNTSIEFKSDPTSEAQQTRILKHDINVQCTFIVSFNSSQLLSVVTHFLIYHGRVYS